MSGPPLVDLGRGRAPLVLLAAQRRGPPLDASGHLVGVMTSTLDGIVLAVLTGAVPQNVNFAVKAAIARNFLEAHRIAYVQAPSKAAMAPDDIAEIGRKFTVRIECPKA